jgi:EAL domain-containing protein (putative c-di-GMP-specific phosphodiesterase class I)/CheY-like chemotaxis protein
MEQVNFGEFARAAHFGHRKLTPRACVVDSKKHLRLFLADALEDLGFVTCECGQAGDLAGVLQTEHLDLIVLSVCVDGINVGDILEAIVRKNFGGKVLVIGQPDSIMVKAVRQIGDEYGIAMLPSLPTPFGAASLRASVAELLPAEPAPSPAVDVAEALKAGWLELWYQQKIDTRSLAPDGAEALVRMRHPAWGVVPPAHFIPDDRDPHFRRLSEFVVGRAIEDWRYLLESQGPVDLSINLPAAFFGDDAAVRDLSRAVPAHPAFGGLLIEIDSGEAIEHADLVVDAARALRLHNIALAVDNVGAEWPSLLELRSFPFAELKVDRQFINGCADDRLKQTVCRRIVELARDNGARAIAQGIETRADFLAAHEMGFDLVQGHLFGKPVAVRKFARSRPQLAPGPAKPC